MFKIPSLPVVSEKVNKDETLKEFSMKDIEKGEVLGGGSFGTTFIAKFNGKEVALKQLHTHNDEVPKFLKEAKIMSCLTHENIVGFEVVCYQPLMFMMELVVFDFNVFGTDKKLTTLEELLRYCDSFMFQKIETILPSAATDIIKGLKYLHSKEVVHHDLKPANDLISNHHYRNLLTMEERNKVFRDKPIICKLCDFGESRSMLKQTKSIACTRTNAVARDTLAYMAPELLPGDMQLQSASLCDYKMADIWSLGMTLFCILHPDLGSPFLIELSETGFDVHRNIGESLSEIILKNKRPKSSTKYQNTLINHWLNMWFALSQCMKINPCERSSLDDVLRALTSNMVPYRKNLPISQASVLQCVDAEIAAGNTTEVLSNEGTNSCTFLSLKSMIELFKRKKLKKIRIQDLLEEIAVETILKYSDQINQYRDISSQYHPYEALEIMKKQDPSLDLFDLKYHLHSGYLALSEEGMLELYGKLTDIRETTKDQLFLATYVCPPYTVSLGIFRQKFFLLDTHKVSSRSGGVDEGVVITTKDTSNQSIEEMCAWLWKRLDNVKSE